MGRILLRICRGGCRVRLDFAIGRIRKGIFLDDEVVGIPSPMGSWAPGATLDLLFPDSDVHNIASSDPAEISDTGGDGGCSYNWLPLRSDMAVSDEAYWGGGGNKIYYIKRLWVRLGRRMGRNESSS